MSIDEIFIHMMHLQKTHDATKINIPVGIATAHGMEKPKLFLQWSLSEKYNVFESIEALCDFYENEFFIKTSG